MFLFFFEISFARYCPVPNSPCLAEITPQIFMFFQMIFGIEHIRVVDCGEECRQERFSRFSYGYGSPMRRMGEFESLFAIIVAGVDIGNEMADKLHQFEFQIGEAALVECLFVSHTYFSHLSTM